MKRDTMLRALTPLVLMLAIASPAAAGGRHVTTTGTVVVHHGYYGPYGHVGWGYPYWSFGVGWGYPYWGVGYGWGWPYPGYVYGPPYPSDVHGAAHVNAGAFELHVQPSKAAVKVDGYPAGEARDFDSHYSPLLLKPGRHILELSSPGHMTLKTEVKADGGAHYVLRLKLQEGKGVDPRSTKATPPPPQKEPPQGTDEGTAGANGHVAAPAPSEEPREDDQAEDEDAAPSARAHGLLHLRIDPPDAAVYLDGKFLGRAEELRQMHGDLAVGTGQHTIEAVRPGYHSATRTFEVEERQTLTVEMDLTREGKEL